MTLPIAIPTTGTLWHLTGVYSVLVTFYCCLYVGRQSTALLTDGLSLFCFALAQVL